MTEDVVIGKFGRPHGVRGEVRFFAYNPDTDLLREGLVLHLTDGNLDRVTIERARPAKKFMIVALEGIRDRDEAAALRNREASVPRDAFPEPDDDEFYIVDVIGFTATEVHDDGEHELGEVVGWLDGTTTDVMIVEGPSIDGRLLVPYVEHVVETLDFDAGSVRLRPRQEWAPAEDG